MANRFEKFSERARRVLTLAQEEAQSLNHSYIGTEHILLGLVREEEGVAAKVLINLGVGLSKVRASVEFVTGRGDKPGATETGLTPRARRVIELAIDEARYLGHNYIGTEHLLLGLLREGEGIAFGVLDSLGITLTGRVPRWSAFSVRPRLSPKQPAASAGLLSWTSWVSILLRQPDPVSSIRLSAGLKRSSG